MYNRLMNEKELNVKVGDTVSVQGGKGTVIEVFHNTEKYWNGTEYEIVKNSESTSVRVHFTDDLANYEQYQDGVYGNYVVIKNN